MYNKEFKSQNPYKMLILKYYNFPAYPVLSSLIQWKTDYYIGIRNVSNLAFYRSPLSRY